jgi:hypothetical protein
LAAYFHHGLGFPLVSASALTCYYVLHVGRFTGRRREHGQIMNKGALKLDASAWPVVHGTRESLDHTALPTPANGQLSFWNSQDQAFEIDQDSEGLKAMPSMEEVMDMLLHQKRKFL